MRILGLMVAILWAAPGCAVSQERPALVSRIDVSQELASKYLVQKQSPDGAWRSETYGIFKDGNALTPFVANAVYFMPDSPVGSKASFAKAVGFVCTLVDDRGKVKDPASGYDFPVLMAASACRILELAGDASDHIRARRAWMEYLTERRLSSKLGWSPVDSEFGGWGFAPVLPRKPRDGKARPQFVESNLVATLFGIMGLRSGKVPESDPAYAEIMTFVKRCQNFEEFGLNPAAKGADASFNDGGFFFLPAKKDDVQNKAGSAGLDSKGELRFHSYGSMTADGLRALIRCGLPPDHPRVVAARKWLERNFSATLHPGVWAPGREALRDAHYYYYAWAVAHAFLALNMREIETPNGKVIWAEALAEELIKRQRPDGSWKNRFNDAKEDDPLIATSWAASALAICRLNLQRTK